jgi:Ser/Thr protein kinase RdoA (MazF antagonist)
MVGLEGNREVLRYIPGDVPTPPEPPEGAWPVVSTPQLITVGGLLRDFHTAAASFEPPVEAIWQGGAPSPFDGTLACHNDPVPGNVVFREGAAIALLDFDCAGLSDPIWDVAIAAQHWVPLADPVDFVGEARDGWNAAERLLAYCDAYQLSRTQLPRLLDAVAAYLERGLRGVEQRVESGEQAFVDYWRAGLGDRLGRAALWVREHRHSLID